MSPKLRRAGYAPASSAPLPSCAALQPSGAELALSVSRLKAENGGTTSLRLTSVPKIAMSALRSAEVARPPSGATRSRPTSSCSRAKAAVPRGMAQAIGAAHLDGGVNLVIGERSANALLLGRCAFVVERAGLAPPDRIRRPLSDAEKARSITSSLGAMPTGESTSRILALW